MRTQSRELDGTRHENRGGLASWTEEAGDLQGEGYIYSNSHPEDCPAFRPDGLKTFAAVVKSAEEHGVRIHGIHVAPWEHTMYGLLETESAESLDKWFEPMAPFGITKMSPVTDVLEAIARREGSSR